MTSDILGDFQAGDATEIEILKRLRQFLLHHGGAATGSEVVAEIANLAGHVTASAWIVNAQAQVLLVFARKAGEWQLPGAHGEKADGDLASTARNAAILALGRAPDADNAPLWALGEREIAVYWNTPAHWHFELIFRFEEAETGDLPRGARWFSLQEAAQLGDVEIARLARRFGLETNFRAEN